MILSGKHSFNGLVCWLCTDKLIGVSSFFPKQIFKKNIKYAKIHVVFCIQYYFLCLRNAVERIWIRPTLLAVMTGNLL